MKRLRKFIQCNSRLSVGLLMLLILAVIAVFAPLLAPYDPYILSDALVQAPGRGHMFGTDGLGRDIFSMILYGSRTSLLIGVTAAMISAVIGIILGAVAGYFGNKADMIIGEGINVFMMMPTFFLILIIVALFGSGIFNVMIVIGCTTWTGNAKLMRAQAMSLRNRTFIKAQEALGEQKLRILIRHVIPNGIFPVIANTTMGIASAILTESSLAFLGLGDPNVVSWGQIVFEGKNYLTTGWWISTFGGIAIIYTVITFFFIGDGLNIILNPKLKNVIS